MLIFVLFKIVPIEIFVNTLSTVKNHPTFIFYSSPLIMLFIVWHCEKFQWICWCRQLRVWGMIFFLLQRTSKFATFIFIPNNKGLLLLAVHHENCLQNCKILRTNAYLNDKKTFHTGESPAWVGSCSMFLLYCALRTGRTQHAHLDRSMSGRPVF